MGVEYYIIKPRTQEKFYLGKDLWFNLDGMSHLKCCYAEYENWIDVLKDIVQAECYNIDDRMEYMRLLSEEIFDFVDTEEVRVANDCESEEYTDEPNWQEFKETKCICEITRRIYGDD